METAKLTINSPEVVQFVEKCQKMIDNEYQVRGYGNPPRLEVSSGEKFIKIVQWKIGTTGQRFVHTFIATMDSETKVLGKVLRGDILKPASFKAPAKHARGNLFDESSGMSNMTSYGPMCF